MIKVQWEPFASKSKKKSDQLHGVGGKPRDKEYNWMTYEALSNNNDRTAD